MAVRRHRVSILFVGLVWMLLGTWGCGSSGTGTAGGPIALEPSSLVLDVKRYEVVVKQMFDPQKPDDTTRCSQLTRTHFLPDRLFLIRWVWGIEDPVVPQQYKQIDAGLTYDFCEYSRQRGYIQLVDSILRQYPENYPLDKRLAPMFERMKQALPGFQVPKIRTLAFGYSEQEPPQKGFDNDRLFYTGDYLGIGLEYFLGPKFRILHPALPKYIRARCDDRYLEVAIAQRIVDTLQQRALLQAKLSEKPVATKPEGQATARQADYFPTFLDKMVYLGIQQAFLEKVLPRTSAAQRLYYADSQLVWANYFESKVYELMLPVLYEQNEKKFEHFLVEGPNTGHVAKDAPPRLGQYIGWRIVSSYLAKNPSVTFEQLFRTTDFSEIFKKSGYKPKPVPS
jgi:hypothetical protein